MANLIVDKVSDTASPPYRDFMNHIPSTHRLDRPNHDRSIHDVDQLPDASAFPTWPERHS